MGIRSLFSRKTKAKKSKSAQFDIESLTQLASVFEILDKFRKSNLLHIDFKRNTVTISSVLSQFFIYDDSTWQNFLRQLHLWATFEYSVSAYRRAYTKAMADAEAQAFNETGEMLDYDARKVKRMEAAERFDPEKEVEKCPDLQFVVLGATDDNKPLLVARYLNGRYVSASVPSQE